MRFNQVALVLLLALACGGNRRAAAPGGETAAGARGGNGDADMSGAKADPNFHVYLLLGQSNMEGTPKPEPEDHATHPRVRVLAYDNCPNLGRQYNQWYTAGPPLHACYAGVGPGDYFGRALANAFPDATIGLVPCAISGVDIDFFRKGVVSARRSEFRIPPDNLRSGAYDWVIERARIAQRSGVIKGIIFHQGESDTGQQVWVDKVQGMVSDLRADLGLGDLPFIAGELLHGGCCTSHNAIVNQLPGKITNTFVIPTGDLAGADTAHFDLVGQRKLGARYGQKMIEALR